MTHFKVNTGGLTPDSLFNFVVAFLVTKLLLYKWQVLCAGPFGDQVRVGARFSAHPSSPTLGPFQPSGQGTSLPDVKRPRPDVDPPHHLTPRLKKEFSCTSALPSETSWPLLWCTSLLLKLLIANIHTQCTIETLHWIHFCHFRCCA